MATCSKRRFRLSLLLSALFVALAALVVMPTPAYARDYEITQVDIDATVREDGTLHVVETRTYAFDGSFNGVYWLIPAGYNSSNGKSVSVDVISAGEQTASGLDSFEESGLGVDGVYEVTDSGSNKQVKLYAPHANETVSFTIAYDATGIVTRWSDTAELYWKFVSDGWDVESQNVTCRLHLPVASGESVAAGDNVRAWGHGPLDGSSAFDGDDVVYTVPGVGTDEFAEMRVTFPAAWVSGLGETSGDRLDTILSEEQQWADEANAKRMWARVAYYGSLAAVVAVAAATVVVALRRRARYRRDFAPQFTGTYFRDVPTKDHPAVLGALYNRGSANENGLTATLMHLTDEGLIRLDKVTTRSKGLFKDKVKDDYRLTKLHDAPAADEARGALNKASATIDRQTLKFLFSKVAKGKGDENPELLFSDLEAYAKAHPQGYSDAYDSWKSAVDGKYLARFSGDGLKGYGKGSLIALATVNFVLVIATPILFALLGAPVALGIALPVVLLGVGLFASVVAKGMKDVNHEAVEVKAQLEALRRWLVSFTHLDEAVPTDVVLWNRLLVMAVALDVADEVIEQLKVAVPEILNDPYFMPTYGWYYYGGVGMRSPAAAFSEHLDSAHHVSAAALSHSGSSSGGGGGGGFSGGGGGGFGGGGGGGAF